MKAAHRTRLSTAVTLLALLAAGCDSGGGTSKPGGGQSRYPAGQGIVTGLSLATLTAAGWTVCYEDNYGDAGASLATILAGCNGSDLMLACRASTTTDTLALAAADTLAEVTTVVTEGTDTFHAVRGVGWYFTDTQAWGFFPAGEPVNKAGSECDGATTQPEKRLCWHAGAGRLAGGYRCGATVDLNADPTWRRLVLVH